MSIKVKDICTAIESAAPLNLQEDYDNAGLQVGDPEMEVTGALLCLDATEEIIDEALDRRCNMIVSHHPLIFKGIKSLTGRTAVERMVIKAIKNDIAVYSAHTNLDSALEGVSYEMAHALGLENLKVLEPKSDNPSTGLGIIGTTPTVPKLEFLRLIKETFNVKALRYSGQSPQIVIRKVALCGGAGASMIKDAVQAGADIFITGDIKYHDYTTYGLDIILVDVGHFESEFDATKILSRIIREKFPDFTTYFSKTESNPIKYIIAS